MKLWREWVLPRLLDSTLGSDRQIRMLRTRTLAAAHGRVLELGVGTGLNFAHYPKAVQSLVAVDPNPGMAQRARERMRSAGIDVEHHQITAETLPFDSASFDCVACTLTLCSIADVAAALREVRRVLKPGGQFLFLEHGRHPDPSVRRWQERLDPLWGRIFDGCHLNRDMPQLIQSAGLMLRDVDNPMVSKAPRIAGYCYLGRAERDLPQ